MNTSDSWGSIANQLHVINENTTEESDFIDRHTVGIIIGILMSAVLLITVPLLFV